MAGPLECIEIEKVLICVQSYVHIISWNQWIKCSSSASVTSSLAFVLCLKKKSMH